MNNLLHLRRVTKRIRKVDGMEWNCSWSLTRFINREMQEAQLPSTWGMEIIHGEVGLDWGEIA